jgi:hypothetical protein
MLVIGDTLEDECNSIYNSTDTDPIIIMSKWSN